MRGKKRHLKDFKISCHCKMTGKEKRDEQIGAKNP